jgi:F420-0:gamma-glutamyl ligase-like protein
MLETNFSTTGLMDKLALCASFTGSYICLKRCLSRSGAQSFAQGMASTIVELGKVAAEYVVIAVSDHTAVLAAEGINNWRKHIMADSNIVIPATDNKGKLLLRAVLAILLLFHGVSKLIGGIGFIAGMLDKVGLPPALGYLVYVWGKSSRRC